MEREGAKVTKYPPHTPILTITTFPDLLFRHQILPEWTNRASYPCTIRPQDPQKKHGVNKHTFYDTKPYVNGPLFELQDISLLCSITLSDWVIGVFEHGVIIWLKPSHRYVIQRHPLECIEIVRQKAKFESDQNKRKIGTR